MQSKSCMGDFSGFQDLIEYFETHGARFVCCIDKKKKRFPGRMPLSKEKFIWICARCKEEQESAMGGIFDRNQYKIFTCKHCTNCIKKGTKSFEEVTEIFAQEGWIMLSEKSEYKKERDKLRVICANGHETTKRFFNWKNSDSRCMECMGKSKMVPFDQVVEEFLSVDQKLLIKENEYVGNKVPMSCICLKCGTKSVKSLRNIRNKIYKGCQYCYYDKWDYETLSFYFTERDCKLLTVLDEYINSTQIEYICICKRPNKCVLRSFLQGKRCPVCAPERAMKTCFERYGTDNVSKVEYIRIKLSELAKARQPNPRYNSYIPKQYMFPSGRIELVQGYEPFCLDELLLFGIFNEKLEEDEIFAGHGNVPIIPYFFNGKVRRYYPDIYIPKYNLLIEVKCNYTYLKRIEQNEAKFNACQKLGYNMIMRCYNQNGENVLEKRYYDKINFTYLIEERYAEKIINNKRYLDYFQN